MPKFLSRINIFGACVDKENKKIYNIKCNLTVFCVFVVLISVLTCVISSLAVDGECGGDFIDSSAFGGSFVRLKSLPSTDSGMQIGLSADGAPFCGMRMVLCYDPDKAVICDIIPDEGLIDCGGVLSFVERKGEIVVIVDLCDNYPDGDIGILVFEALGREICFEVRVEEVYFWQGDRLITVELPEKAEFSIIVQAWEGDDGSFELVAEMSCDDDAVDIVLRAIAPARCLAAGFEFCVVDLESLEMQSFSVASVLSGDAARERVFSQTVGFSSAGRYCIIVEPVVYFRSGAVTGREIIIVVDNGSVLDDFKLWK